MYENLNSDDYMNKLVELKEYPLILVDKFGNVYRKDQYKDPQSGKIFCKHNGKPKKLKPNLFYNRKGGYKHLRVVLCTYLMKHKLSINVSRLVALAWVPNPYNKPFVCHIDNNPLNNDYRNLYWGTHKENMEQMVKDGRSTKGRKLSESHRLMLKGHKNSIRGELHYKSKLTNSQRIDIINYWLGGSYSLNKLSEMYNVSRKCIRSIINRGIDFYKI